MASAAAASVASPLALESPSRPDMAAYRAEVFGGWIPQLRRVGPNWEKGRAEASSLGEEQIHSKCFEFTVKVFIRRAVHL